MRVNPGIAERATDAVEFAWRGLKELAMHVESGAEQHLRRNIRFYLKYRYMLVCC